MVHLPKFDPMEFLTHRKFGNVGSLELLVGRQARKNPALARQITAYQADLNALSPEQCQELLDRELAQQKVDLAVKTQAEEQARFFYRPWATASFEFWSKAAHWTLDEAIALSLGKAPERVNWKNVEPFRNVSTFAHEYSQRRELALRAITWQQLYDPVLPGFFLAWAKRTDLAVPDALEAAVRSRGVQIADWKKNYDDKGRLRRFEPAV